MPEVLLVVLRAGRRCVHVLRALEVRLLEGRLVDEEVLRAGLAPRLPVAVPGARDGLDRLLARHVDDVEGRTRHPGELDCTVRRLALGDGWTRTRMPDRLCLALGERLLDEDVDRVPVLRMHHDERAGSGRHLHRPEERLVVDHHGALVGHEELVRGDALVRELRKVFQRPGVLEIGDPDMEADVDDRLRTLDLLVVVRQRFGKGRAGRLHAEVDQRRRAAERSRHGPGREVVARDGAAERHLEVRVRVDRTRHDDHSGGVDDLVGLDVERVAHEGDRLALDVDVTPVVVGGGDDTAALDQHGHGSAPFVSGTAIIYYASAASASAGSSPAASAS